MTREPTEVPEQDADDLRREIAVENAALWRKLFEAIVEEPSEV